MLDITLITETGVLNNRKSGFKLNIIEVPTLKSLEIRLETVYGRDQIWIKSDAVANPEIRACLKELMVLLTKPSDSIPIPQRPNDTDAVVAKSNAL